MSLPEEKIRAIEEARRFLFELMCPSITKRVPSAIRKRAASLLKHYPYSGDTEVIRRPKLTPKNSQDAIIALAEKELKTHLYIPKKNVTKSTRGVPKRKK